MTFGGTDHSPAANGRRLFEIHCAGCHGPSGEGGYFGRSLRPQANAGKSVTEVIDHVRHGEEAMPVFSPAVLSDQALGDLAGYVHETLGRPPAAPAALGPVALDPILVGAIAWFVLAALVAAISALFAENSH